MVATPSPLPVRRVQRILGGGTCFGLMVAATTYTYALVMPELRTSLPCGLDAEHTNAQDETGHKREAATSAVAGRHG